jgi:uncharacterized protein
MQFNLDSNVGKYQINSFKPGQVVINKQIYINSIIIAPEQIITNWQPQNYAEITEYDLKSILDLSPQIVIIGTGEQQHFLDQELLLPFLKQGIGIEIMNTDAACRTYNVLMSEGRNIVAGLLLR